MSNENNKMQVDIDTLKKQNVNDLLSIKELYKRIEELGEKITQIKYIDSNLANKLKKEYEKLEKIILDKNIQTKLTNDIKIINSQLDTKTSKEETKNIQTELTNDIKIINSQLDTKTSKEDTKNIQAKLDNDIKTINSQMDTKANLNEVIKKGHVTLNDCDVEMLSAIQGGEGTNFELLSIPRDNSVDLSKLNGGLLSNKYIAEGSTRNWARVSFKLDKVYKDCELKAEFYCTPVASCDVAIQTSNQQTNKIKFVKDTKQFYSVKVTLDSTGNDCFILTTIDGMTYNLDGVYENIQIWVDGKLKQITECIVRDGNVTKVNPEVSFLATQNFVNEKIDNSLERDIKNNQVKIGGFDKSLFGTKLEIKDSSSSFCNISICKLKNNYLLGAKVNISFSYYPTEYNGEISIRTDGVDTPSKKLFIKTGHKNYCEYEFSHNNDFTSIILKINSTNVCSLDGIIENLIVKINDEIVSLVFDDLNFITILENNINGLATLSYVDNQIKLLTEGYVNKKSFELPFVNNIYVVQGIDSSRKQSVPIFIDYLYNGNTNKILFENGEDRVYIRESELSPKEQSVNIQNTKETLYFKSDTLDVKPITFNKISIEEKTENGDIRLLIIGDSVTAGAITQKQYWAEAYELFVKEDIDRNRNSKVLFLGSCNVRKETINYNGVTKDIKSCACGISSWSLTNWLTNSNSHFVYNDNGTPKFSILKWIERYRTHLDDGTKLELGDSRLGSEITSSNINNIQCCTPNIIYINSTHNGGTINQHEEIINIIRNEIPNCKIIVGNPMPLVGSWHKEKYIGKDWLDDKIIDKPNYGWQSQYGSSRIESLMYYVEKEKNTPWFYFMPQCVTMPTVESLEYDLVDYGIKLMKQPTKVNQMPREHPSTLTHKIWGYELYALLKYISGVNNNATNNFDEVPLFD